MSSTFVRSGLEHSLRARAVAALGVALALLRPIPSAIAQEYWDTPGVPPTFNANTDVGYDTVPYCTQPRESCRLLDARNVVWPGFWGNDFGGYLYGNCRLLNCAHDAEGLVWTLLDGVGENTVQVKWMLMGGGEMHCECPPLSGGPHDLVDGYANFNASIGLQVRTVPPGQTVTVSADWWGMLLMDCQGSNDIAWVDFLTVKLNGQELLPPSWQSLSTTDVKTLAYYPPAGNLPLTFTAQDGDIFTLTLGGEAYGYAGWPGVDDNLGWSDWAEASFQGALYLSINTTTPSTSNPAFTAGVQPLFSLDIGSDAELSDPTPDGNEGFDPGDLYPWQGPALPLGGADGVFDDALIFGADYWPAAPDAWPPLTRAQTCTGVPAANIPAMCADRFDLDGTDLLDVELRFLIPSYQPLVAPLPKFPADCIFGAEHLVLSFDDDWGGHYAGSTCEVPVGRPSAADDTWGRTRRHDEIVGVEVLSSGAAGSPATLSILYPIFNETELHQSLAPNPDAGQGRDDDVDALDISMSTNCSTWYFSPDHEATGFYPGWGTLDPGAIYEVSALGGIAAVVVDENIHLGLSEDTDIRGFEFVWLSPCDLCGPALALIFSVAENDYLTNGVDESGGLNPNKLYGSFLTGSYFELASNALPDPIDAITAVPRPYMPILGTIPCPGDMNCDRLINFADINPFVLRLSNPVAYGAAYPNCPPGNGDINGNGVVGFDDIIAFVALLSTVPPPVCP
jgi:hypothetical protein